jgi:hypothetical protein
MSGAPTYHDASRKANGRDMTCAQFQEQLPELFERGEEITSHPHLRDCDQCGALVRDLRYIAQQAKLLLPIHDPSPAVWNGIQASLAGSGKSGGGREASGPK